jgi:hypothetical protein
MRRQKKTYALTMLLEAYRAVKKGRKKLTYFNQCMKYSKRANRGKNAKN